MVKSIPTTQKMVCLRQHGCLRRVCIESVGGIGKVLGCRLRQLQIVTAHSLYSKTKCMSQCQFIDWFVTNTKGNRRLAGMAYKTLYGKLATQPIKRNSRKQHTNKRLNTNMKQEQTSTSQNTTSPRPSDVSRVTGKIACFQSKNNQRNIDIGEVAGIGCVLACRLREQGILTAGQLRSKTECYSVCKFKKWMKLHACANTFQSSLAYTCIHEIAPVEIVNEKLCTMKTKCK